MPSVQRSSRLRSQTHENAASEAGHAFAKIEFLDLGPENGIWRRTSRANLAEISTSSAIEGSMVMPVDQKNQNALKLSKLKAKLPENPRVVDVQVEDYVDTDGEDALRVLAILEESVDVENIQGEDVSALKSAIRNAVREQGVDLWTYIGFAKQSELDEAEEEDEE